VKELKDKARQYKDAATKERERATQLEVKLA
jgi:chromosome segregation ATPase